MVGDGAVYCDVTESNGAGVTSGVGVVGDAAVFSDVKESNDAGVGLLESNISLSQ